MNEPLDTTRHMQALESALLILVDRLAMRGAISVDEGIDILQVLSRGTPAPAPRLAQSLNVLSKLHRLRGGDSSIAPGAPGAPLGRPGRD